MPMAGAASVRNNPSRWPGLFAWAPGLSKSPPQDTAYSQDGRPCAGYQSARGFLPGLVAGSGRREPTRPARPLAGKSDGRILNHFQRGIDACGVAPRGTASLWHDRRKNCPI